MSKLVATESFLNGIKNDTELQKRIYLTSDIVDALVTELNSQKRGFSIATPIDIPKSSGAVVSYYTDAYIDRPMCIRKVGSEYWVASRYQSVARFNSSWEFLGRLGRYGEPLDEADPDKYMYSTSIAVDTENDRIAVCMEWRHCVKVFRLSSFTHLWTFGNNNAGPIWENKLWNPKDVEWMPDGNLLVTCYNGYGQLSNGTQGVKHGHISILNGQDGSFIRSVLAGLTDGSPWLNEVYHPCRARIFGDKCYITYYYGNCVAAFDLNTWSYVDSYFKPTGLRATNIYPRGIWLDGDDLIVTLQGPKVVGVINLTTHELVNMAGYGHWEDSANASYNPGALWDVWDVIPTDNGYIVADEGNNRLTYVPAQQLININVVLDTPIPDNVRIIDNITPWKFNKETSTITVDARHLSHVKPFVIPYEYI